MDTDTHGKATMRCEHLACVCNVDPAAGTCSEACATAARDANSLECTCGHEVCATANAAQLRGEAGRENPTV